MKTPDHKPERKPLLAIECDTLEQKVFFSRIARERGMNISALMRSLMLDEGRRLGLSQNDEQAQLAEARRRKWALIKDENPDG